MVLALVGLVALITMLRAMDPSPTRIELGRRRRYTGEREWTWVDVLVEVGWVGVLTVLRAAGVPSGWIIGVCGVVALGCVAGAGWILFRGEGRAGEEVEGPPGVLEPRGDGDGGAS
jgi:hypothetical protein